MTENCRIDPEFYPRLWGKVKKAFMNLIHSAVGPSHHVPFQDIHYSGKSFDVFDSNKNYVTELLKFMIFNNYISFDSELKKCLNTTDDYCVNYLTKKDKDADVIAKDIVRKFDQGFKAYHGQLNDIVTQKSSDFANKALIFLLIGMSIIGILLSILCITMKNANRRLESSNAESFAATRREVS